MGKREMANDDVKDMEKIVNTAKRMAGKGEMRYEQQGNISFRVRPEVEKKSNEEGGVYIFLVKRPL